MKKHIISVLVENHFGVLSRISSLFSARAYNINSLTVGETENKNISRMTIVVTGDDKVLEQVIKQLNKLVDVIKVKDITSESFIDRELLLIKVSIPSDKRSELLETINIFRGKMVKMMKNYITIELTGDTEKIDSFINFVMPYGIKELIRSGKIALKS